MQMTGNSILITGGTSGIGRAMAVAFHERGNSVIVTGRRKALLDKLSAERPGLIGLPMDVNDPASVSAMAAIVGKRFPDLNVVIANAGISLPENSIAEEWDVAAAAAIIETNILGVLRVAAALVPLIKGKPNATFMATSSSLAFIPRADFPTYSASKAFLHSWLQSLRHQLRAVPVDVFELAPPYVQTELMGAHQASDPKAISLSSYVAEVMGLLERGEHPRGELLVERDRARRWAERDDQYEAMFNSMNPN